MALLCLRGLRKSFGTVEVLHGIDAAIADGEFVVIVGPSGSGKTTLLRMVAGLERVSAGEIALGGRIVNDLPPKERDMAMVFQQYALYPHMTVRDNLGFSLRMRNESAPRIAARVAEVAEILGLDSLLERYPSQLSGGQQQRVAIGRAIARKPRVFLFDEPLSNLDGSLRAQMRTELKSLHRRFRTTSLYVTHDQTEAMAMADRLIVLREGRVEQAGTPLELYDRPANLFVAGFIGVPAMNLVPGRISNGCLQTADGAKLPLPGHRLEEGRALIYGFRPEACALSSHGVPVRISAVEHMGASMQLFAQLGSATVCVITSERGRWRAGQEIRLQPASVQLFDPASGESV